MSLGPIFPGYEICRNPLENLPAIWRELISMPREEALFSITECFGLYENSAAASLILESNDIAVFAPQKKRERKDLRFWKLAVSYSASQSLIFSAPTIERLRGSGLWPETCLRVVSKLGAFQFHRFSGELLWPCVVEEIGQEIHDTCNGLAVSSRPIPFFNHVTGDYDCWLENNFETAWVYDHERANYSRYCEGGFVGWFEKRFREGLR